MVNPLPSRPETGAQTAASAVPPHCQTELAAEALDTLPVELKISILRNLLPDLRNVRPSEALWLSWVEACSELTRCKVSRGMRDAVDALFQEWRCACPDEMREVLNSQISVENTRLKAIKDEWHKPQVSNLNPFTPLWNGVRIAHKMRQKYLEFRPAYREKKRLIAGLEGLRLMLYGMPG